MRCYLLFTLFELLFCFSIQTLPKLTIDEFLNSTVYASVTLSPNGQHVLVHTNRPSWESNRFENTLWLHETQGDRKKLITKQLSENVRPKWSPSGDCIVFTVKKASATKSTDKHHSSQDPKQSRSRTEQYIYLYNILSEEILVIDIRNENLLTITWGNDDTSLYFASVSLRDEENKSYKAEWKDVIQYRQKKTTDSSTIYRIDFRRTHRRTFVKINTIKHVDFLIGELLFVPLKQKLVFTSVSPILEYVSVSEVYSIDLHNTSPLSKLTNNEAIELNLKLSSDGKHVFFMALPLSPSSRKQNITQQRLYSIDLTSGKIERWARDFYGHIVEYAIRSQGGVYIVGQLGVNSQIYKQRSSSKYSILQRGWSGTYRGISSSTLRGSSSVAFIHSSFEHPEEVYFVHDIRELHSAKAITCENQLLTERNLPRAKVYKWVNSEDDRTVEGILHYPPGKFESKNLPLLVFIHGGPIAASLNILLPSWGAMAPLAATEGWLVLEPNYRGSTGYGDKFIDEIRSQSLSLPGRDILAGVDCLIANGIADPNRLAVGGYSYGGYLTNWLITQTTRFNAALSGAGPLEHISFWGLTDVPAYIEAIIGGFPWDVPEIYEKESIMYQLGKVRTPTHIVTGTNDVRVPPQQSLILERGLHYLDVPVKLLLFPNEGHSLSFNPWHGKIKVREELKWLEKYGHQPSVKSVN